MDTDISSKIRLNSLFNYINFTDVLTITDGIFLTDGLTRRL
jgi:hypothetical protein